MRGLNLLRGSWNVGENNIQNACQGNAPEWPRKRDLKRLSQPHSFFITPPPPTLQMMLNNWNRQCHHYNHHYSVAVLTVWVEPELLVLPFTKREREREGGRILPIHPHRINLPLQSPFTLTAQRLWFYLFKGKKPDEAQSLKWWKSVWLWACNGIQHRKRGLS